MSKIWNVIVDGNNIYKSAYLYCGEIEKKRRPNGLAVGVSDGEIGAWIPPVLNDITNVTLIEESEVEYKKLLQNYLPYNNVRFINCEVTTEAINHVLYDMRQIDWLYLNDGSFISGIYSEKLPPLIIYKNHLASGINDYLRDEGYFLIEEGDSMLAIKNR